MGSLRLVISIRVLVFALMCFFNYFIEDYDSCIFLPRSHVPDTVIGRALSGFAKWDALFFLQIAHEGYLYEKNSAFFPVFPLLIRGVGEILSKFFWVLSKDEAYLIAGVLISFIAFLASVRILEKLTNLIFKDGLFSKSVCIMFSLSPASIFLSAIYSEALFSAFSLTGIYLLYKEGFDNTGEMIKLKTSTKNRFLASLFFAMATGTRSNGTFLFIFQIAVSLNDLIILHSSKKSLLTGLVFHFFILLFTGLIHASPLFTVLGYGYNTYCQEPLSPYCTSLFPNIYNYVQEKYWNVGLLRYWELKQIPNFLLAFPMILISFSCIFSYFKRNFEALLSLGTFKINRKLEHHYLNPIVAPFIVYWAANLFILVFIANVQIITRTLSSLPVLYWFICQRNVEKNYLLQVFFASYFMVGIVLFSNFYPWT